MFKNSKQLGVRSKAWGILLSLFLTLQSSLVWGQLIREEQIDAPIARDSEVQAGGLIACVDAGSTDTYTCNLTPALTAYTARMFITFVPNTNNTGAATVNVNSLGAKSIIRADGAALQDGDLVASRIYRLDYDGAAFRLAQGAGSGGGSGISGLTTNTIPKATGSTTIGNSQITDDGATITHGNCGSNCLTEDRSAITGAKTHTYPNVTGTVPIAANHRKIVEIQVFPAGTNVAIGDGKAYFRVPSSMNGMNLVAVAANVMTAGTTGTTDVQIARCVAAATGNVCSSTVVDMLSTKLTIDSAENSSSTAATAAVINTSNDDVSTGQILRIDVDAVSTTAPQGLLVALEFSL